MIARRIALLAGIGVMAAAGANLFLYLFRWEWNRALIAGMFLVAAEIAVLGFVLLERVKSIESRVAAIEHRPVSGLVQTLEDNAPPAKNRFAWLTSDGDNLGVFIPFILGAGLVVSGVAWVVERVARATAAPVLTRRLALRLAPVTLPSAGLMGTAPAGARLPTAPPRFRPRQIVISLLVVAVTWAAIDALADATQTRPDKLVPGSHSVVTLDVKANGRVRGLEAAHSLWATCRGTVPSELSGRGIVQTAPQQYVLRLEPALGAHGQDRLGGCFSDATIANIQGSVLSIEHSTR